MWAGVVQLVAVEFVAVVGNVVAVAFAAFVALIVAGAFVLALVLLELVVVVVGMVVEQAAQVGRQQIGLQMGKLAQQVHSFVGIVAARASAAVAGPVAAVVVEERGVPAVGVLVRLQVTAASTSPTTWRGR